MRTRALVTAGLNAGLVCVLVGAGGCAHKRQGPSVDGPEVFYEESKLDAHDDGAGPCGGRVHFALDSAEISPKDQDKLVRTAACMKDGLAAAVRVEGNADERGTEEYNLALGDRRANAVARYLSRLGASPDHIQTVSYGEENPLCDDHREGCWEKNRRAAVRPTIKGVGKED